jgi:hypothetical protein
LNLAVKPGCRLRHRISTREIALDRGWHQTVIVAFCG